VPALDFLGHRLSATGVTPLAASLQVMNDFPRPHTVKDLQRFLGMVNFYQRFFAQNRSNPYTIDQFAEG
jgi:hypothetical protein